MQRNSSNRYWALGPSVATGVLRFVACWLAASGGAVSGAELVTCQGRHIRIVTDLPDSPQLSEWAAVFDAAVPQWAAYWQIDPERVRSWQVVAYLMTDKTSFSAQGLLPDSLPDFRHGYQAGNRIWVLHQASEYYTRHLLLHEGTHAFTAAAFGGSGPPWYMEGTAEFLGTHHWSRDPDQPLASGQLRVGIVPVTRESALDWGRIELIQRGRQSGETPTIETVMRYGEAAHREVEPYAWSWLAVTLLEMYPEYRAVLRSAARRGADQSPQFTRALYQQLQDQWPTLVARWRLLSLDMEYGYDAERHRVDLPSEPLAQSGGEVMLRLAVDRGWQAAPIRLAAGQRVDISAEGRFVVRQEEQPWESEAQGVTIQYHRGWPLGCLLACVLPTEPVAGRYLPELDVIAVGQSGSVRAEADSWLLFKINEPAGEMSDNEGQLQVRVIPRP